MEQDAETQKQQSTKITAAPKQKYIFAPLNNTAWNDQSTTSTAKIEFELPHASINIGFLKINFNLMSLLPGYNKHGLYKDGDGNICSFGHHVVLSAHQLKQNPFLQRNYGFDYSELTPKQFEEIERSKQNGFKVVDPRYYEFKDKYFCKQSEFSFPIDGEPYNHSEENWCTMPVYTEPLPAPSLFSQAKEKFKKLVEKYKQRRERSGAVSNLGLNQLCSHVETSNQKIPKPSSNSLENKKEIKSCGTGKLEKNTIKTACNSGNQIDQVSNQGQCGSSNIRKEIPTLGSCAPEIKTDQKSGPTCNYETQILPGFENEPLIINSNPEQQQPDNLNGNDIDFDPVGSKSIEENQKTNATEIPKNISITQEEVNRILSTSETLKELNERIEELN